MQRFLARAPVRVDPAGGGTDAPPFSVEHGGRVVNFAIQRHAFASVDRLPAASGVIVYSKDLEEGIVAPDAECAGKSNGGRLEFLSAFVRRLVPAGESILLVTESDVPPGAGLGGSGALGVAVVAALDRAFGRTRAAEETAAVANSIERQDLGYPGGNQDSYGAALGGILDLEYHRGGRLEARRIDCPLDARLALEESSLLLYTSEAHVSGSIHRDIRESYARAGSTTVDALTRLRESAASMAQALGRGDLEQYVAAMRESSHNLYRLHPSCDSEEHRRAMCELAGWILGGKTCGAGGGGFLLVHARPGCRRECRRRAEELGALVWPVTIDFEGVQSWTAPALRPNDVDRYRRAASGGATREARGI